MRKNYVFKSVLAMLMGLLYLMPAMAQVPASDWKLLQEVEGVKAYYKLINCSSKDYISLRIENSSATEKKLIWVGYIKRGGEKVWVLPSTMEPKIIKVGERVTGDCNNLSPELMIPIKASEASNFNLKIVIKK